MKQIWLGMSVIILFFEALNLSCIRITYLFSVSLHDSTCAKDIPLNLCCAFSVFSVNWSCLRMVC
jgi:hypothetical protein